MAESSDFFGEFARRFQQLFADLPRLGAESHASPELLDRLFGSSSAAWLVPEHRERSRLEVRQRLNPGGVQYVVVARKGTLDAPNPAARAASDDRLREWLWPTSQLPPTDLVYDVAEELLHGKAKPILCDLTRYPIRVFALLPTQLEQVSLRAIQNVAPGGVLRWEVVGADASERRIAGRLPFAVSLADPAGQSIDERYLVAAPDGRLRGEQFVARDATPGAWTLRVRSQLNGLETTLPVQVYSTADAATRDPRKQDLTHDGAESRWAPRPIAT